MIDVTASCNECLQVCQVIELDDNYVLAIHMQGEARCPGSLAVIGQAPEPDQAPPGP